MADYHIYLHSDSNGSSLAQKTKPFADREDGKGIYDATKIIKNAPNTNLINTGVSSLTKAVPVAALVIAGAEVVNHILSTGFAHQEEYTGNYINNVNFNNFKTRLHDATHPISYALQMAHRNAQMNKQNKQIAQQNTLIGETILKDFKLGV